MTDLRQNSQVFSAQPRPHQAPSSLSDIKPFSIPSRDDLQQRLTNAIRAKVGDPAALIVAHEGVESRWSIDVAGNVAEAASVDELKVPVSCMIKLYTATLVVLKCEELGISLDTQINELLNASDNYPTFAGVTFRHLLQNTHGLDDPYFEAYAALPNGRIDLDALHDRAQTAGRLFEPGAMYSYNDIGPAIAGGVLERIADKAYRELLQKGLLERLGMQLSDAGHLCPSSGGPLRVSAEDLLRLIRFHMPQAEGPRPTADLALMREDPVEPPAWTTLGMSACMGWNAHPGGWFGYIAGTSDKASQLIRFNPATNSVIAIVSAKVPVYHFMLHGFSDRMPECAQVKPFQFLTMSETSQLPLDVYIGSYECAALALDVMKPVGPVPAGVQLMVRVRDRLADRKVLKQTIERPLRLAADDYLYTMPVEPRFLANGRFLQRDDDGRFKYVWNGRQLWRRVDRECSR